MYTPTGDIEYGNYAMWINFDLTIGGVKLDSIGECIISVLDTNDHLSKEDIELILTGLRDTGKLSERYKYTVEYDESDVLLKEIWISKPTFHSEEGIVLKISDVEDILYTMENPKDSELVREMFTGGKIVQYYRAQEVR